MEQKWRKAGTPVSERYYYNKKRGCEEMRLNPQVFTAPFIILHSVIWLYLMVFHDPASFRFPS
ncbi:MAG: hypothetical protein IKD85_05990, partial [Firmicutes bacterium]|nr:hypothetical protein [Bacillota bacterium]